MMVFVNIKDKSMSGWGRSEGKTNIFSIRCKEEDVWKIKNYIANTYGMSHVKTTKKPPVFDESKIYYQKKKLISVDGNYRINMDDDFLADGKKIISFSGVQGSGKTTMMNKLKEHLKNETLLSVETLPSINREYINKLGLDLSELRKSKDGLKVWEYFTLKEHFTKLREMCENEYIDVIITDRCYFDFIAYSEITIGLDFAEELYNEFLNDINYIKQKSLLINTEPVTENTDNLIDGVRDLNTYDSELSLYKSGLSYYDPKNRYDYILENDTVDNRLYYLLEFIESDLYANSTY